MYNLYDSLFDDNSYNISKFPIILLWLSFKLFGVDNYDNIYKVS